MDTKQRAQDEFTKHENELRALSKWMYANPELGYQEYETSRKYVDMLAAGGFDVEYPVYGLDTAFAARIGASGPEVIICAEMDALPEVGHACGHNIIGTASIGAGLALAPMVDELGIRLTVLGTPAEEAFGGKVDLIEAGAYEGAAAAMMIHPATKDLVDPEFLAVAHIDVEFFGHETHASGAPDLGINALDAAVQAYVNVSTLRQQLKDSDRVHGIITHGGAAPNIIPAYTAMSWYIRAATDERLDELYPKVIQCFEAAALATGCSVEIKEMGHRYKDMISNSVLVGLYQENSERAGRKMNRVADLPRETSGSTDMGNVSHEVPSIHPVLDLHCYPIVNHQKEFASHTLSDDGERAIADGALAMAWTIIDLAEGDLWGELTEG
ncbi:MAG: M20 family metallopeptidase [Acidimicrobiia bacterium]|nr:MAG: M20 family metallopeptidase [Acidimicrobiia bacterium]